MENELEKENKQEKEKEKKEEYKIETETIKMLKAEYENKIATMQKSHDEEIKTIRNEHTKQLRSILLTGKSIETDEENDDTEETNNFIEKAVERLKRKL